MSVTLLEVMAAAQARRAPLVAELAGYLVLGAADQSAGAPRHMRPADVVLQEDGGVRVVGAGNACASDAAEQSLRALLRDLMLVASSATPALFRTAQRPGAGSVDALIGELETALIPVNRSAARRALSRLHRETVRALDAGWVDVAAFEAEQEPPAAESPPPGQQEPLPGFEAVAAPLAPESEPDEPEPEEWSVPIEMLQSSPVGSGAQLALGVDDPERSDDVTAPETVTARAREGAAGAGVAVESAPEEPEVVLELSPPAMDVEPSPLAIDVAIDLSPLAVEVETSPPATRLPPVAHTPVLGTLCDPDGAPAPLDSAEADRTDRAPPVFEPDPTRPLELDAEMTRVAPPVTLDEDEEIEWIEVEPSIEPPLCDDPEPPLCDDPEPPLCDDPEPPRVAPTVETGVESPLGRDPEPFSVAPSADPPGVQPQWRPSVVVAGGTPVAAQPDPPVCQPEPTPPLRVPGEEPAPQAPARFAPRQSDVSELLDRFSVADTESESELRGNLKRLAGLEPTPPPAATRGPGE